MLATMKVVAIGIFLALIAFAVATIVLAVQKSNLTDELNDALDSLETWKNNNPTTSTPRSPTTQAPLTTTTTARTQIPETTTTKPEVINYRLPDSIYPINYDLYLHPDIATGNFTGQMRISVQATHTIKQIVLHSNKLEISSIYLDNTNNPNIYVSDYYFDAVREFLVVELSEELPAPVVFDIGIIFGGNMAGKIVGLYSSSYTKANNSKKIIATSKFEPTYARLAFPSFDEPAMKATFDITLVYPKEGGYHALSNMDILSESTQGNFVEAHFRKSVPMSTYLACFIVSDFTHKSAEINTNSIGDSFTLRAFATPEQIDKVDFALSVGKSVLEYYIQYFQIEYPLPKMDMAAIPDFVSGAMEHWGLVTYRETALLYDKNEASTANKQRVALVIAHEFAHMWFGNLVTMKWWNDLWLNEGFARYIENKGLNAVFPEWKMLEQFITTRLHDVLTLDATLASHPIRHNVESPAEITEIFDTITYGKGGSVIRMLEDLIGATNFQKAVTNYLNAFKFKNAVTDDFLTEIDKLNLGYDIKPIMDTWIVQMGFPVVTVEQVTALRYRLTQKRFFSNPGDYNGIHVDSPYNYTWSIPITFKTSASDSVERAWLLHDQEELIIDLRSPAEWIKFNYDQIGLYRVNYPDQLWQNLVGVLGADHSTFSAGDRAGLLNDAFSLADATQLPYGIALDMTKYLSKEKDYVPWSVAANKLATINRALMFTKTYANYKKYARALIDPIYGSVKWEVGSDHLENLLRQAILNAACSLGLESCLEEAGSRFKTWLANSTSRLHPDIRETVYYYGMATVGNEETWLTLWEVFVKEADANERTKLMNALAAIQVPWILSYYVDLAWNENNVRGQDYFQCLQYIAANPVGESIVWNYVREHWLDLVARFGINERTLGNLIPGITKHFDKQTKLEEMQQFFAKFPEAGAGAAARSRALETVKNNIVWLANNEDNIDAWLKETMI